MDGACILLTKSYLTSLDLLPELYAVPYLCADGSKAVFYFDDKALAEELWQLFIRLNYGGEAKKVGENFRYAEVHELYTIPEDADYIIASHNPAPPYYCLEFIIGIMNAENPEEYMETKFYFCFTDRRWALWMADIVDRVFRAKMDTIGMG